MESTFYRKRQGKLLSGVLAGLSDKFRWDLALVRILAAIFFYFSKGFVLFLYLVLTIILPYKEDVEREAYGMGPRKRKEAQIIDED